MSCFDVLSASCAIERVLMAKNGDSHVAVACSRRHLECVELPLTADVDAATCDPWNVRWHGEAYAWLLLDDARHLLVLLRDERRLLCVDVRHSPRNASLITTAALPSAGDLLRCDSFLKISTAIIHPFMVVGSIGYLVFNKLGK